MCMRLRLMMMMSPNLVISIQTEYDQNDGDECSGKRQDGNE